MLYDAASQFAEQSSETRGVSGLILCSSRLRQSAFTKCLPHLLVVVTLDKTSAKITKQVKGLLNMMIMTLLLLLTCHNREVNPDGITKDLKT